MPRSDQPYTWDPGNPWQVVKDRGSLRIVEQRIDETAAYKRMTEAAPPTLRQGDTVTALQTLFPVIATVVTIAGDLVTVRDNFTGTTLTGTCSDFELATRSLF